MNTNQVIYTLESYWRGLGYEIVQPYDSIMGAATFHPVTFFGSLSKSNMKVAFAQRCRRPGDKLSLGSKNMFYQYQVVVKPYPESLIDLYWGSLSALGICVKSNDVRLLEDNWKSPTLCAYGKGWEVNCNGYEITQITNFDLVGGCSCKPSLGEIAYGVDRISDMISKTQTEDFKEMLGYGGFVDKIIESESSEHGSKTSAKILDKHISYCKNLLTKNLTFEAYDFLTQANYHFNILCARGIFGHDQQTRYTLELNRVACAIAESYKSLETTKNKQQICK